MQRQAPQSVSFRSHTAGGARGCVDTVDDTKLMQEHKGQMFGNEGRDGLESPQNYGFTSVNAPADKDGDKITGSAETFYSFQHGHRSFPIPGPIDDRRHRLRGLSSGDSAIHRGKDDDMQIHLAGDGMYHSAPQMVRVQLVPPGSGKANPPQNASKAPQAKARLYAAHGPHIEKRLWAGLEPDLQLQLDLEFERLERARGGPTVETRDGSGGSSGGGGGQQGGQQQQNKPTGQKAVNSAGADSKDFMHVKNGEARLSSASKVRLSTGKDDGDTLHESSGGIDYVGGTPAKHKFSQIITLAGPSKKGKAWISD